jgi:hypothetical protein
MADQRRRAEDLMMMSGAARRLADLVAVATAPLRFEVMRHLLRVSEESMIETLEEAVALDLVKRGADAFTYVPFDRATRDEIVAGMTPERIERLRAQIAGASSRVFE